MHMMAGDTHRSDPPPERPDPSECCGGGCSPCIFDLYEEELARWRERQARREQEAQQRKDDPSPEA
jgi:hypothetical protein